MLAANGGAAHWVEDPGIDIKSILSNVGFFCVFNYKIGVSEAPEIFASGAERGKAGFIKEQVTSIWLLYYVFECVAFQIVYRLNKMTTYAI